MVTAAGTSVLGDQSLLTAVTAAQVGRFSVHFAQAESVPPVKVGRIFVVRYRTSVANRAYVVYSQSLWAPGVDFDPMDVGMASSADRLRVWADWYVAGYAWTVNSDQA
jgi:hypothetical protein